MKRFLSIYFILLVLCGCASVPTETQLKETLKETAEAYWKLRMEDRYEDTYKMESRDGLLPFAEYYSRAMAIKKFKIVSLSVKSSRVDGMTGLAEIELRHMASPVPTPLETIFSDEWVYEGGKWRHRMPRG